MAGPRVGGAVVGQRGPREGARVAGLAGHLEDRSRRHGGAPRRELPEEQGAAEAEGLDGPREGGEGVEALVPVHLGLVEVEAVDEGQPAGAGEAHAQRLRGAGAEDLGGLGQEGAHLAPRDRAARVERPHAEGGPLGLVHEVPAGDGGLAAVALGDRGEHALEQPRPAGRVADVVAAPPEPNAVHDPAPGRARGSPRGRTARAGPPRPGPRHPRRRPPAGGRRAR